MIVKSLEVRVQGVAKTMPAERRRTRPKARTRDKMISPKTRKPVFDESSMEAEKQTEAIIEMELQNPILIKTTCSFDSEISEFGGRPSFVIAERVNFNLSF